MKILRFFFGHTWSRAGTALDYHYVWTWCEESKTGPQRQHGLHLRLQTSDSGKGLGGFCSEGAMFDGVEVDGLPHRFFPIRRGSELVFVMASRLESDRILGRMRMGNGGAPGSVALVASRTIRELSEQAVPDGSLFRRKPNESQEDYRV